MKTLYLAWQDPLSRCWFPVGRLTRENGKHRFVYIQGCERARMSGFNGVPSFPDLYAAYEADELFPLFANRLMPRSRPDYADFVRWLSSPEQEDDPFALLALSGGQRATGDTLAVYPCPEKGGDGNYHLHFFAHGLSHQAHSAVQRAERLAPGEKMLLLPDVQNEHDPQAIMLRTAGPEDVAVIGWFPRYLAQDINRLLCETPSAVVVAVERVNPPPAPVQFRLLCNLTVRWPDGFSPFTQPEYQPVAATDDSSEPLALLTR